MHSPIAVTIVGFMISILAGIANLSYAQVSGDAPGVRPDAIVDLTTDEGIGLVKGQWRSRNAKVIDVDHRSPGIDLAPSGPPNRTQDIDAHAGAADFDDSQWKQI